MTQSRDIRIRPAADDDSHSVDRLLWDVLWRPIGLPRNIREQFRQTEQEVVLVADDRGMVVGAIVGQAVGDREMELRHLAVQEVSQLRGVGSALVATFLGICRRHGFRSVCTHARNTTVAFFEMQGFVAVDGEVLTHPDFARHGIHFQLMRHNLDSWSDVGPKPEE